MTTEKRNSIIYWIAALWLSLGMIATGLVQLMHVEEEINMMTRLGYPAHLLTIIGVWKFLGVIVVLIPRFPLLKEWAYAGFFFVMSGAVISHLAVADPVTELVGPLLLIALTATSWYFRPQSRTVKSLTF